MRDVEDGRYPLGVTGLAAVHKAHIISSLCEMYDRQALVITPDDSTASRMAEDMRSFGTNALHYPARDFNFRTDSAVSREYEHARLKVLDKMLCGEFDAVVLSAEAVSQLTIPPDILEGLCVTVKEGESMDPDSLVDTLIRAGYVFCDEVDGPGLFARRGGILDFFPPDSAYPYRIEFWGDDIDGMSMFDPATQRSIEKVSRLRITPSREVICRTEELVPLLRGFIRSHHFKGAALEKLQSDLRSLEAGVMLSSLDKYLPLIYPDASGIFDYAGNCFIAVAESFSVRSKFEAVSDLNIETIKGLFEDGILCRGLDRFSLSADMLIGAYNSGQTIYLDNFPRGSFDTPVKDLISFTAKQSTPWNGSFSALLDDITAGKNKEHTTVILTGTEKAASTLCSDLEDSGISVRCFTSPPKSFPLAAVCVMSGSLSAGFEYPGTAFTLITYLSRTPSKKAAAAKPKRDPKTAFNNLDELCKGDYVVHSSYGIGIFDCITEMNTGGVIKDYIKIIYDKGDVLYVPVTQLDMVSKYIGTKSENGTVKLNHFGGKDWQKTKAKVKSSVVDMAKQLIALYSKRMKLPGYAFSPDIDMQHDFECRFEFEETDDQLRCISEIKADMEQPHPMDRLLCGDVGFGKTEVALRAAFKCIADGKQCAILVPTTILALQHYQTVSRRFDAFPVEVGMLSRFTSKKDTAKIIAGLKNGMVDLVVGTHRLISKDVEFRDLGLMIIDEEQRFGVAQKEKLKEKFPTVDVLTLTATPIPRTLNMAMTGIRDMSVLEQAPMDRSPVQTYVIEHNMPVLVQAMEAELRRGGQVYYLHNRVDTIEKVAARIKNAMPDANVGIAHGKMSEEELSDIWRRLLEGETDILVCTTIIETGVDVPNVNTLIIEDADKMGLAQLHQLRGRVGRSSRRASAYFTFQRGSQPSDIATRRLDAIREFTEFGSGFHIAMRDLEIRGAGNVLGAQQHGQMDAVGYEMYVKLLEQAISEEKGETDPDALEQNCLVNLPIDAYIPTDYIESVPHRLKVYRRIADVKNVEDARDVIDELIDRFGDPPPSVDGLIKIALIRSRAVKHDICEISRDGNQLRLHCSKLNLSSVNYLTTKLGNRVFVNAAGAKPIIVIKMSPSDNLLVVLNKVLNLLDKSLTAESPET